MEPTSPWLDRRLFIAGAIPAAAVALDACTQQQVTDVEKQIADFINQVQVAVKAACAQVGNLIPTANSVIAIIQAVVGSTNPAVITAAVITQVVAEIVAVGCPATPPSPTPTASPPQIRGVPVVWL